MAVVATEDGKPVNSSNPLPVTQGLPTAAALADNGANPSTSEIGADVREFNETGWDRRRNNTTPTVVASGAITATANGADQTNYNAKGVVLVVDITAQSGTTPTYNLKVQVKDPTSGKYVDLPNAAIAQQTGVATVMLVIYPGITTAANAAVSSPLPRIWRVVETIAGTTPSFTRSIGASYIV